MQYTIQHKENYFQAVNKEGTVIGKVCYSFSTFHTGCLHVLFHDDFVSEAFRNERIYDSLFKARLEYITANYKNVVITAYCEPTSTRTYKRYDFIEDGFITIMTKTL